MGIELNVTVLGSGSAGNAVLVRRGRSAVLIDAGLSARQLARRLEAAGQDPRRLEAVLISHEHGDHVRGAAVLSRRFGLPVLTSVESRGAAGPALEKLAAWQPLEGGRRIDFVDLSVRPFPVPHDAVCTFGFEVTGGGLRYAHATDLGHANRLVVERMRGAHLMLLEANHDLDLLRDGPYPWSVKQRILSRHGHLSNDAASDMLPRVVGPETRAVFLAHISETNNDPGLALAMARQALDHRGTHGVVLHLTRQDRLSETVRV